MEHYKMTMFFQKRGFLFERTLTKYTFQRIDEAVDVTPLIAISDALAVVPFPRASAAAAGTAASHTARTTAAPSTPLRDISSTCTPLALLRWEGRAIYPLDGVKSHLAQGTCVLLVRP